MFTIIGHTGWATGRRISSLGARGCSSLSLNLITIPCPTLHIKQVAMCAANGFMVLLTQQKLLAPRLENEESLERPHELTHKD